MNIYLVILDGERKGDRFKVKAGLSLGRSNADINLRDPKASSKHALIRESGDGFKLVDNKSTNGVKVGGRRVSSVELTAGLKFSLGLTTLEVVFEAEMDEEANLEEWRKTLLRTVSKAASYAPTTVGAVKAFSLPVSIEITQQKSKQTYVFSYGPRAIDSLSLDLNFEMDQKVPILFHLVPEGEIGVKFQTPHPDYVQLNGRTVETDMLKDGDVIRIQGVELKVSIK